jgi:hypothetical protein
MGISYIGTSRCVIDAAGDYTIDRDMTLTDPNAACVLINPGVHYVNLRLRSRVVYGGPSSGTSRGIELNGNAAVNIIGDGGSIAGFYFGIRTSGAYLTKIVGVSILNGLFRGMDIDGDDAILDGNDIRNITGTTFAVTARTAGINLSGARPKILRNHVDNIVGMQEEALGISITDRAIDGLIAFNSVKCGTVAAPLANGNPGSYGIWVGGDSVITDQLNVIERWAVGVAYSSPPSGDIGGNQYVDCLCDRMLNGNVELSPTDS